LVALVAFSVAAQLLALPFFKTLAQNSARGLTPPRRPG
jgi:hypothetical protein